MRDLDNPLNGHFPATGRLGAAVFSRTIFFVNRSIVSRTIVAFEPTHAITRSTEERRMKQVFVARNPAEAHLVKGFLETRGIHAEVRGEALWGTRGETPLTPDTLPSVWVLDEHQVPEAMRAIKEYSS